MAQKSNGDIEANGSITRILGEQRELARLFVIAAILAFATGGLASLFVGHTPLPLWSVVTICILLAAIGFSLLAKDLVAATRFQDTYYGAVFLNARTNELVPVRDYKFGEDVCDTLRAVKVESRSLYSDWESGPLRPPPDEVEPKGADDELGGTESSGGPWFSIVKVSAGNPEEDTPKALRLLGEAVQFVILESLSIHLSEYFSDEDDSFIRVYQREDIPKVLLTNRVINLLTTPIDQRDAFFDSAPHNDKEGEVVAVYGPDGHVFQRFELALPTGSEITHSGPTITIETKRLKFTIEVRFSGTQRYVTPYFASAYVGVSFRELVPYSVDVILAGRVKPLALFSSSGWNYYRWFDSFREKAKAQISLKDFLDSIGWNVIEPLLFVTSRNGRSLFSDKTE